MTNYQYQLAYPDLVSRIVTSVNLYLSSPDCQPVARNSDNFYLIEEEISSHMQRLKLAHAKLIKTNSVRPPSDTKEVILAVKEEDETVYAITRLDHRLTTIRKMQMLLNLNTNQPYSFPGNFVKLTKLQLKSFSGDPKEWLPFWEQFKAAVQDNIALSDIEKFNYLQSVLTGRAAEAITDINPSQSLYDKAITLLLKEYGDTEELREIYVQKLISLPAVTTKTDVAGLRRLYNDVTLSTRSLTALGVSSTNYCFMLRSILLKCLPNDLRVDYCRLRRSSAYSEKDIDPNDEDSSLDFESDTQLKDILKFLKREVDSLKKLIMNSI